MATWTRNFSSERLVSWTGKVTPYEETRRLIVTADDFCCAPCIDAGSLVGVQQGIVTTLTAITTYADAARTIRRISQEIPHVGMGVHLNLTSGFALSARESIPTLLDRDGQFYAIERIMARLRKVSLQELELEFRTQIAEFLRSGARLDHLSYHHNLPALYSPFFEVVLRLAKEFNVPLRNPIAISALDKQTFRKPATRVVARRLATKFAARHPFKAVKILKYTRLKTMQQNLLRLQTEGIKHPDHVIDYFYGNPTAANLRYILENLPPGTSELVFHLGTDCDPKEVGKGVDKHYLTQRMRETAVVTNAALRDYLTEKNIQLISFSDL